MPEPEKPKIISDDDWKTQAQKEKEKISETAKTQAPPMPPASFLTLINTLAMQALLYMGRLADPNDEKAQAVKNLDLAKHHIDLLQVLEEKTKGNLTDEESQTLSMVLHEIRMQYVQEGA